MSKWAVVVAILAAGFVIWLTTFRHTGSTNPPRAPETIIPPAATRSLPRKAEELPPPRQPAARVLSGNVLLTDGRPAAEAVVKLYYFHDSSGYGSAWLAETKADAEGRFNLRVPDIELPHIVLGQTTVQRQYLVAFKAGFAAGIAEVDPRGEPRQYSLRLSPARDIRCFVKDTHGAPVKDAVVTVDSIQNDEFREMGFTIRAGQQVPLPEMFRSEPTDRNGETLLKDVHLNAVELRAAGPDARSGTVWVSTISPGDTSEAYLRELGDRGRNAEIVLDTEFDHLKGRVVFEETGRPAASMVVCPGAGCESLALLAVTDPNGRFVLNYPRSQCPDNLCVFDPSRQPSHAPAAETLRPDAQGEIALAMPVGALRTVRIRNPKTTDPVQGAVVRADSVNPYICQLRVTDSAGECCFRTNARSWIGEIAPPPGCAALGKLETQQCEAVDLPETFDFDMELLPTRNLDLRILMPDGQPAPGAWVAGLPDAVGAPNEWRDQSDFIGRCRLYGFPQGADAVFYARVDNLDTPLGGKLTVPKGAIASPIEIRLEPAPVGEIVMQDEKGNSLDGQLCIYLGKGPSSIFGSATKTQKDGNITWLIPGLPPDTDFYVFGHAMKGDQVLQFMDFQPRPDTPWRFGKDEKHPRLVITYAPHAEGGPPPPPRPRTDEDFQADVRALTGVTFKKQDPVQTGVTWYGLKVGLAVANAEKKEVKRIAELLGETEFVVSGIGFGKDKVWVGTSKGLFAWDRKDMFWTRFAVDGKFIELPVKELSLTDTGKPASAGKLLVTIEHHGNPRKFEYDAKAMTWQESP